jgi:hypothetical protein
MCNFIVEGVSEDGSRTELMECETSGEARDWLAGYVHGGDDGGWPLIEIYDLRGEPERIAFYECADA